jgi:hypothetical protein
MKRGSTAVAGTVLVALLLFPTHPANAGTGAPNRRVTSAVLSVVFTTAEVARRFAPLLSEGRPPSWELPGWLAKWTWAGEPSERTQRC